MTKELSIIVCRSIALFFILKGLSELSFLLNVLSASSEYYAGVARITLWGNVLIPVLLGSFLFWKSKLVAYLIAGKPTSDYSINDESIVRAGTFLLGLWLIVTTTSDAVIYLSKLKMAQNMGDSVSMTEIINNFAIISRYVIGITLMLGSSVLSKLYRKLKYV